MAIKFRLRQLMEDRKMKTGENITYRVIEEKTGVSKTTLSAMSNQRMRQIGINTIERLLDFFECEPNDLIIKVKKL